MRIMRLLSNGTTPVESIYLRCVFTALLRDLIGVTERFKNISINNNLIVMNRLKVLTDKIPFFHFFFIAYLSLVHIFSDT